MKRARLYRLIPLVPILGLAALLSAAGGGCAMGHTFVLDRPSGMPSFEAVYLREGDSTSALGPALKDQFETALRNKLAVEPGLRAAPEPGGRALTIEYRIVAHEKGSAAARVVGGAIQVVGVPVSGLGDGTLGVDVTYRDGGGAVLAHIVADGPIAGVLGSSSSGLEIAAASIAAFTRQTFAARDQSPLALH